MEVISDFNNSRCCCCAGNRHRCVSVHHLALSKGNSAATFQMPRNPKLPSTQLNIVFLIILTSV